MKNILNSIVLVLSFLASSISIFAKEESNSYVHEKSSDDGYVWPSDSLVLERLDTWQDAKFGVLFHFGLYSVPGIVESWQICSEDWITRPPEYTYEGYKQWYWGLANALNPTDFNPQQWAQIMHDAGMKYMIFTMKHHDGFCMFDSKTSDFSIAKSGPFAKDPQRDLAAHVFNAFRQKGFMTGAYFSKPDWHCKWFWNPYYSTPNRMQNYKRDLHPDWWQNYVDFTQSQMDEILSNYGPFDIFWLDGGWIAGDEVGLDEVLEKARAGSNPGLIAVDRVIKGKNENYQTPERSIPNRQIAHPWESCIPLSHSWAWAPDAKFKSANEVVSILAEISAKGGCLLLGVGPTPQGTIQEEVADVLHDVGKWLEKNGEAIYATRITPHYNEGNIWFSRAKDNNTMYAIMAYDDSHPFPKKLEWTGNIPQGSLLMLNTGKDVKYTIEGNRVIVSLPKNTPAEPLAFKFAPTSEI